MLGMASKGPWSTPSEITWKRAHVVDHELGGVARKGELGGCEITNCLSGLAFDLLGTQFLVQEYLSNN
jgi:hypothetical protein